MTYATILMAFMCQIRNEAYLFEEIGERISLQTHAFCRIGSGSLFAID